MQYKKPSNYAFIDAQNVHLSIKRLGWQIDDRKFRKYLSDKYNVQKAFLFIGFIATNEDLYKSLQEAGFVLIFKPILSVKGQIKGNVDAELVLQTMIEYPNYDKAVIVSGDGDFHCLIKYLMQKNKLCKVIVPDEKRYSWLLRKFGPYLTAMNKLRGKISR